MTLRRGYVHVGHQALQRSQRQRCFVGEFRRGVAMTYVGFSMGIAGIHPDHMTFINLVVSEYGVLDWFGRVKVQICGVHTVSFLNQKGNCPVFRQL